MGKQPRTLIAPAGTDQANRVSAARTCNLCVTGRSRWLSKINGYSIVQCEGCGHVYVSELPDSERLRLLYDDEYYHADDQVRAEETHWKTCREGDAALFRHVLDKVSGFQAGGSLLDVGCSYGFLLLQAKERGYTPYGVELAEVPSAYCRNTLGFDVFHGDLDQADYPDSMFSVVTMLNVLEHVPDVRRTLNEVYRLLVPGGVLALVVPNWVFGWPWVAANRHILRRDNLSLKLAIFDVPRHLHMFSPKTLRCFLERSRLEPLSVYNAPVIRNQSPLKTAMKFGAQAASDFLYAVSFKRWVVSYSMAVIARKPLQASAL